MASWETPRLTVIVLQMFLLTVCGDTNGTSSNSNPEWSSGDPCPDPDVIAPCKCTFKATLGMDMDCSRVTSEDELRRVFSNDFQVTDFRLFTIIENQNITSLREGDLGSASFTYMQISFTSLTEIQEEALKGSFQTLVSVFITDDSLKFVPDMSAFTRLQTFRAYKNEIYQFPNESSAQLILLDISSNHIDDVPEDAIVAMKSLETLGLGGNSLTEIHPNTFTRNEKLSILDLGFNRLTTIPDDAITLYGEKRMLTLSNNQITNLTYEAVSSVNSILELQNNNLTELPEEVFRPFLEDNVVLFLYGNPFKCGCDMAWLVLNQTLLKRIDGLDYTICSDGELFTDLDPEKYRVMCPNATTVPL